MNFYVSICQLLQSAERLERDFGYLAGRALRNSPRDSRANRELLEQCAVKAGEVKEILGEKSHLSKTTLRHAALLFQILQLAFRRILHLAEALPGPENADDRYIQSVHRLLSAAHRHYGILYRALESLSGLPITLELYSPDDGAEDGLDVFQREDDYQQESLRLLQKAMEAFNDNPDLYVALGQVRKEITDLRKRLRYLAAPRVETAVVLSQS